LFLRFSKFKERVKKVENVQNDYFTD